MKTKILAILIVCLGLLALMPNGTSTTTITVQSRGQYQGQFSTISSTNNDTVYNALQIQANDTGSTRGLLYMEFIFDLPNIETVQIALRTFSLHGTGANISVHNINITQDWNSNEVTWNTRNRFDIPSNQTWDNPGGDYNQTSLDTLEVNQGTSWYYWDITEFYLDSVNNQSTENNYGFIFISNNTDSTYRGASFNAVSSSGRETYPKMIYTYSPNNGTETDLYEDVWNLEGYFNSTSKLASIIYTSISDCTALVWKNDTTGYWYTYWPSLGLTEDKYLNFGDGLFILTDQDTTWDHT